MLQIVNFIGWVYADFLLRLWRESNYSVSSGPIQLNGGQSKAPRLDNYPFTVSLILQTGKNYQNLGKIRQIFHKKKTKRDKRENCNWVFFQKYQNLFFASCISFLEFPFPHLQSKLLRWKDNLELGKILPIKSVSFGILWNR